MARYPTYTVAWSEEDGEFVATCDWLPSLSFLHPDPRMALNGFTELLHSSPEMDDAVAQAGEVFNRRASRDGE